MEGLSSLIAMAEHVAGEADEDFHVLVANPPCPAAGRAGLPIHMAALPNGRRVPILKTMLTSACERNCNYCGTRAGRDFRRVTFSPEEMAQWVVELTQAGFIEGAFISSGIAGGGMRTQDKLLDTAEILRTKYNYQGYLHLKIMPGAEYAQVEQGMKWADRVSINLEAPNSQRLSSLAPQKVFIEELISPLRWVEEIRHTQPSHLGWNGRWSSSTTQFVAGGSGESDLELLQTTVFLHRELKLSRVYYSGFSPVPGTPLENQPAIHPWRQNRLYQASFLIRDYGFELEDMPFENTCNLPLDIDPKLAWARQHLSSQPVEINQADLHDLIRIPGIGPRSARVILENRRKGKITRIEHLTALGISVKRALPFILLNGRRPSIQLTFLQ